MTLYYTVQWGYNKTHNIEGKDLLKAMYAKMTGGAFTLQDFFLEGTLIQAIYPNLAKSAGWNEKHKITPEDEEFLRNTVGRRFDGKIGLAKEYCALCIAEKRQPDFSIPVQEVRAALGRGGSSYAPMLAKSFKLN